MNKRIIIILALTMVLGMAGTAFATTPFSDVPAKHWAYSALAKLAAAGVVDGYSDGTFQGDKVMTRYEMAMVVGRAIDRQDKANAEQQALIQKLSAEFANELNSLGVRVTKLETNQPNFKITGQADFRYTDQAYNAPTVSSVSGQYRVRLDGTARIDDNTTFGVRLKTAPDIKGTNYKWNGSTFAKFGANGDYDTDDNSIAIDRVYLTHPLGVVKTTVGAQALNLGIDNFLYDSGAYNFDGLKFEFPANPNLGNLRFVVNWGRTAGTSSHRVDLASIEANGSSNNFGYGMGYAALKDNGVGLDLAKYTYGYLTCLIDTKASLSTEFVRNGLDDISNNTAYTAYALLGDQKLAKAGDQNWKLAYYSVGKNSISRYSAYDLTKDPTGAEAIGPSIGLHNHYGYNVTYTYQISPTFSGSLIYDKVIDKEYGDGSTNDYGYKYYRILLTAKF